MATNDKVYVPSTFANIRTFDNGGEIINIDFIDAKEFIKFIQANSADGKFKITVQKQKDPTKASVTLNTYVPKGATGVIDNESEGDDDLPF